MGRIYPAHVKLNFRTDLTTELVIPAGHPYEGLDAKFRFHIKDSEIEVSCYLNRVVDSDLPQVFFSAYEVVRSAVDLMAFSTGIGLTLVLDKAVYTDGSVREVQRQFDNLPPLCTAFTLTQADTVQRTLVELLQNRVLLIALRDLTETLEDPLREGVNCARAIEALSRILAPQEKSGSKRWVNLQRTLNVSQAYLEPITEHSKGPRHGNYFELSAITQQEVQLRAWTVMNRFLEHRRRGAIPLPISEFPVL
jgi:hypothetical protein